MNIVNVKNVLDLMHEDTIGSGEWRFSKDGILYSIGGYTCTLAAVHIPEASVGFLGHFSTLVEVPGLYEHKIRVTDTDAFETMLQSVKGYEGNEIAVWLGGASLSLARDETDIGVLADRDYAVDKFSEIKGVNEFMVDWQKDKTATDVLLDCRSGELLVQAGPVLV